ncbi:hypothetical protein LIER_12791 [Lithospermum erythrorhizon]|uniref:Uncharacterized protein n=1 Tax=Lithospermum erythrorhizon TaxID=34254 RepID=A0AAV3PT96_LITER
MIRRGPLTLAQAKRDAELFFTSAAAKAKEDRIHFVNDTLRSFLSTPTYDKKVGREYEAYLAFFVTRPQGKFPDIGGMPCGRDRISIQPFQFIRPRANHLANAIGNFPFRAQLVFIFGMGD